MSDPNVDPEIQSVTDLTADELTSMKCVVVATPEHGLEAVSKPMPSDEAAQLVEDCRESWTSHYGEGCILELVSGTLGAVLVAKSRKAAAADEGGPGDTAVGPNGLVVLVVREGDLAAAGQPAAEA